jgi:hypothetical protein
MEAMTVAIRLMTTDVVDMGIQVGTEVVSH